MSESLVRVGDVLRLERFPIVPDPSVEYVAIGVRSFGKGIFHYEPTGGSLLGSLRFYDIKPGCLVVSNIKGWEGAVAVASSNESGCIASNRFLTYVPVDGRIDISWARWYFLSEEGIEQLQRASPGSADRNRTLAIERFENLEIPLPDMTDQRTVVHRLDSLRSGSAETARLTAKAAKLAAALQAAIVAGTELSTSEKLRRGWVKRPLGDGLAMASNSVKVEPTGRYKIAGVYSFGRGLIDRGEISGADTAYKTLNMLREENILVSKLNGWEGAVAVVDSSFEGYCVSSEFPVFEIDRELFDSRYLAGLVKTRLFWDLLNDEARGSMVRRRRISGAQFLEAELWCPPLPEQARLGHLVAKLEQRQVLAAASLRCSENLVSSAINECFAEGN